MPLLHIILFKFERIHFYMIDKKTTSFSFIINLGVQYILDSIFDGLVENPDRRYIYVEIAFFWRWWNEKSEDIRNTVKQLVNDG